MDETIEETLNRLIENTPIGYVKISRNKKGVYKITFPKDGMLILDELGVVEEEFE